MMEVVCAIIVDNSGKVLAAQRSATMSLPLKWEFPGGKVEAGETSEQALTREIDEELGLRITIISKLQNSIYAYADKEICLIPYICRIVSGEIHLREHVSCLWLGISDLNKLDWAEADKPIAAQIIEKELLL